MEAWFDHCMVATSGVAEGGTGKSRLTNGSGRSSSRIGFAAIIALAVGLPAVLGIVTGAISVPVNDDWAFGRVAIHLYRTGQLQLIDWGPMFLLGHLAWGQPFLALFGGGMTALHLAGIVSSGIALCCAYGLARPLVGAPRALIVTAVVGFFPGFGVLAVSFMTDPTALAAQLLCLWLGARALSSSGKRRRLLLALSIAAGLFGFTVREPSLAAPIAVMLSVIVTSWRRGAWRAIVRPAIATFAMGVAVFVGYVLRATLANSQHLPRAAFSFDLVHLALRSLVTIAFAVTPALALRPMLQGRLGRRTTLGIVVAAAAVTTVVLWDVVETGHVFLGNGLTQYGYIGQGTLRGLRPAIFPIWLWLALSAVALLATSALLVTAVRAAPARLGLRAVSRAFKRSGTPTQPEWTGARPLLVGCYGFLSLLAYLATTIAVGTALDRYLLPVVFTVALGLLGGDAGRTATPFWRLAVTGTALAMLAAVSSYLVLDNDAYDRARWDAGQALVARGFAARSIDAGFEWAGWHSRIAVNDGPLQHPQGAVFYAGMFPDEHYCVVVTNSRLDVKMDAQPILRRTYTVLGRTRVLYAYRTGAFGCP